MQTLPHIQRGFSAGRENDRVVFLGFQSTLYSGIHQTSRVGVSTKGQRSQRSKGLTIIPEAFDRQEYCYRRALISR